MQETSDHNSWYLEGHSIHQPALSSLSSSPVLMAKATNNILLLLLWLGHRSLRDSWSQSASLCPLFLLTTLCQCLDDASSSPQNNFFDALRYDDATTGAEGEDACSADKIRFRFLRVGIQLSIGIQLTFWTQLTLETGSPPVCCCGCGSPAPGYDGVRATHDKCKGLDHDAYHLDSYSR
eukprot:1474356-Rhodomonas_salina.1